MQPRVRFGPFVLDRRSQRLLRDGSPVEITQRALAVLDALVSQPGEVVSREDLVARVWPRTVVTDAAVAKRVQEVRGALGDDHRAPRFIETIPRRGFRFVGSLAPESDGAPPFVGREASLQALEQAWRAACAGVRTTVFVTGEPGIGKTALVRRFLASLPDGGAWLLEGHSSPHGEGEPYLPIATALAELVRDPQALPLLERHAPSWAQLVPGLTGREHAGGQPRLLLELSAVLDALAALRPVVLTIEDLHWCDPSSVAVLDYVMRKSTGGRILIVITLRDSALAAAPDAVRRLLSDRLGRHGSVELNLVRLDAADVARYLEERFDADVACKHAAETMRCSEGLPLFVAWLGDWLKRALETNADGGDTMPDSLTRLFELELASLGAADLALIETASVIGISFAARTLASLTGRSPDDVDRVCRLLMRGNSVLVPRGGLTAQRFAFTHALLRDALYQRIAPERRPQLHGACGDELLATTPAEASQIALHYSAAERFIEAAAQFVRAGRNAIAAHGLVEARAHFEAALAAFERGVPPRGQAPLRNTGSTVAGEIDALLGLGHCLVATTGYAAERVGTVYERACALAKGQNDPVQRYAALNGLATFLLMRGRLVHAARHDAAMFEAADASGDATLLARAHAHRGERYYYEGRLEDARDDMTMAVSLLARGVPDPIGWANWTRITITVHEYLSLLECERGNFDSALVHVNWMFDALARNPHPYSECMAHYFAALTRMAREDFDVTATHAARMHALSGEHHYYDLAIWADIIEGHLDCRAGFIDRGIAKLRIGLERIDASGVLLARTPVMLLLAEDLASRGDHREALDVLAETERLIVQTGERGREPALHFARARALAAAADPTVEHALERTYDTATAMGSRLWQLRALTELSRRRREARPRLAAALSSVTEGRASGVVRAAIAALAAD